MKILLVVPMVPQADGAGAIPELLHAQLIGLLERHDVTVVGVFGDLPGQAEAAEELERSGLDVHFVDRRRSSSWSRRWRVRLALAARWAGRRWPWRTVTAAAGVQPVLDRLAATRTFDVVAIEDNTMSVFRFPPDLPVVLTEHEAFRSPGKSWGAQRIVDQPARALRRIDWRRWARFQLAAWGRSDLIQVFSRSDAEAIARRAPGVAPRLRINPFGLTLPGPADPAREVPGTLLFFGTFTHLPNRDAALWLAREILPRVVERRSDSRLRIVGLAPTREILALAGPHVEIVADAPSVRPHLGAASVVLAPVRHGGGMRMKVLQALAAGKAVVTTSSGAEGFNALDPSPPLVIADSASEIAAATAALLDDRPRREELGRQARGFAERHHSPRAWARRLEAVYQEARGLRRASSPGQR